MDSLQPLAAAVPENQMIVKSPPSLLTIPGEVRNRIYHHLLLVGCVNVFSCATCCAGCDSDDTVPDLAILRVNRQINREASALLYSTSTFAVATGRDLAGFMTKTDGVCLYTGVTETFASRSFIRSLEIRFVADYLPAEYHERRMKDLWSSADFRNETRRTKAKYLHDLNRTASEAVWGVAGGLLCLMHGLQNLTVDVEQAFCPAGCCRLVDVVARSLQKLRRKSGLKVNVTGSLDDDEVKAVTKAFEHQEASNAPSKSDREGSDTSSDDGSDSHSDDDTMNDGSDGNEEGNDDESSNNRGHIGQGHDGTAGGQTTEGSGV